MREDDFKRWLEDQQYAASTISTQLSSVRTIEQAYGDIDELFERDALNALTSEFTYSAADRAASRTNPTKLKLWGDNYRDLAHLRATLNYYRRFRQGVTRIPKGPIRPNYQAVQKAMDEFVEVGAVEFMQAYDFSWNNLEYYAAREGVMFPAKAIFAVAHQFMPGGTPLDSNECDGTEAHQHLASLGFEITKRPPILLFGKDGQLYEPVIQTHLKTGRKAYRIQGPSNKADDAIETIDLAEVARAIFVDGLAARIAPSDGGPANYLTYPGQKFSDHWLRPDLAAAIGERNVNGVGKKGIKSTEMLMSNEPTNFILHGPPGTGKTWRTAIEAVRLCDGSASSDRHVLMERYKALEAEKRIAFVTFHQSMDYESFVEGLRPETDDSDTGSAGFHLEARPGIFKEICALADQARRSAGKALTHSIDLDGRQFWKMGLGAIGTEDEVYEGAIAGNYIALGWGGSQDWSDPRYESAAEVEKVWKAKNLPNDSPSNYTQLWPFRAKMKTGDIVIVPYGNSAFRAIAEVVGDYQFVPSEDGNYCHRRNVRWLLKLAEPLPLDSIVEGKFTMRTLYPIQESRLNKSALRRLLIGDEATSERRPNQFVLIIDEINRANISKVLGELITLLEPDKRLGQRNALEVVLPYSRKPFGVPDNLHVIGTMNTADRSIALLDSALRRRFRFIEVAPDSTLLTNAAKATGLPLVDVLEKMNDRIEYLLDRDHRIGHAFFIDCLSREDVDHAMRDKVIPLLQEYFFEDWGRVAAVLGENNDPPTSKYKGSFLECRRLKDPTNGGAADRLSWSVRAETTEGGFADDAYKRIASNIVADIEVPETIESQLPQ